MEGGINLLPLVTIMGYTYSSYYLFNFVFASLFSSINGIVLFRRRGYTTLNSLLIVLFGLSTVYVGGRLTHAIIFYQDYIKYHLSIFRLQSTGIILVTGVLFSIICVYAATKLLKKNPYEWLDILVLDVCIGAFFAKIGCFFAGCCGGIPTNLPWGVVFPNTDVAVHPTQLYESAFVLILCVFLYKIYLKNNYRDGDIFKLFGFSYMLFRTAMYFLRSTPPNAYDTWLAPVSMAVISLGFLYSYIFHPYQPEKIKPVKKTKKPRKKERKKNKK